MSLKYRLTLAVAIVLACFAPGAAQKEAQGAKSKFKHDGKFQATYDRAQDRTVVAFMPYVVKVNHDDAYESVAITAGFIHPGQVLTSRPQFVEFGVLSQSRGGWEFEQDKDRELSLVIDGETINVGVMKLITARRFTLGRLYYREDLGYTMPYEGFMRMASAKKVSVKVGRTELKLKNEHLEALRELASRAATP
jgi:hypothetical protein